MFRVYSCTNSDGTTYRCASHRYIGHTRIGENMHQDLRSFVRQFETTYPEDVLRVSEPVDLKYDIMALVLE